MFIDYFYGLILAIIQGITEFIPVSSSSHLIIFSELSNFNFRSLEIDVSLHLGSLIAIILYFRKDLIQITKNKNLVLLFLFGSLPLFIVGFFIYYTGLIDYLREIKIIAWTTLIFGIVLYFADKFKIQRNIDKDLTIKNILLIGLFQVFALIPGASRSGIVITGSRFLNFSRYDAAKISFILSIPALLGASVLTLKESFLIEQTFNINVLLSIFFSYVFSYLTIKYFLIYTKKFSLNIFVVYRILLSLILFYFIYF